MKIIQVLNIEDSIVGLGDDGQMYDYIPSPYVILGLKSGCWTWVARPNVPHYRGKVLVEDESARLAGLTVGETLTLIDKNRHQFSIQKTDGCMVAKFTSHGFDFYWEFRSAINKASEKWELVSAIFVVQTSHEVARYTASAKDDRWELCS